MVPKINRNGSSFRGAGRYHLHDKGDALDKHPATSERVAWTATRNLVNDDPQLAIDEMWHTAEAAAHLKRLSGHDQRGRKCDDPVKTISLSWAPSQSPTREEMEGAADSFLQAMGWQEHQTLLIRHTDTAHPHLHIILNRVHPDTGRVLNDWREQQRAQRWADQYDREQGLILCHVRAEKYEKERWDLQADGMPYPYAKLMQEQERGFENPLAETAVQDQTEKNLLAERHRQEREIFLASGKAQFRHARQGAYRHVRDEFKPHWREHFRHDHHLRERFEQRAAIASRDAVRLAREGDHEAATERLALFYEERDTAFDDLAASRKDLRAQQLEATRERQDLACLGLIEVRAEAFQEIKDRQKEERAEFKELVALRDAGQPYDIDRLQELIGDPGERDAANDNTSTDKMLETAQHDDRAGALLAHSLQQGPASPWFQPVLDSAPAAGAPAEQGSRRLITDGIAAAIQLGISLLEAAITPSSPLEQAQAKARAIRREQEAPIIEAELREQKLRDDFTRFALAAVREAQAEQDRKRDLAYEERDRGRSRELER